MLIRFKVGNYTSFDEVQTLSMMPGRTEAHPKHLDQTAGISVLRAAVIYGANASGKSNLIKALRTMRDFVAWNTMIPTDRYFRPVPEKADSPSYFEVEMAIGGRLFSYGFEYIIAKAEIVDEWLYVLHTDEDSEVVFQRTGQNIIHHFEGRDKQILDVYAEDTVNIRDRLFINVMGRRARPAEGGLGVFNDVFDWFRNSLRFVDTKYPFSPEMLVRNQDFEDLNRLMASFGTGINSIGYERREGMDDILPKDLVDRIRADFEKHRDAKALMVGTNRYASMNDYRVSMEGDRVVFDEIVYRHNNNRVVYHSEEESDGTRRLYGLMASMFVGDRDATFIVDELNASLHPKSAYRFVEIFMEVLPSVNSQLVFTTNESMLMDFHLLRRDEIWFMSKDEDGRSTLYSLEDFNERNDRRIEKAYREGRYGGNPVFDDISVGGHR